MCRIYNEEWAIDARLNETFGVTRKELIPVVAEVVGARNDAVDNDPITAAGLFAYIHGTRNIRGLFRTKGWYNTRKDNLELVRHPERTLMVAYQSVDLAASETHMPQAISGKGKGAERVIDEAQMSLFGLMGVDQLHQTDAPINTGLWHFCVSVVGDDVRAELSLSEGISGGNFKGFIERIFILGKDDWDNFRVKGDEDGPIDFEPIVARK